VPNHEGRTSSTIASSRLSRLLGPSRLLGLNRLAGLSGLLACLALVASGCGLLSNHHGSSAASTKQGSSSSGANVKGYSGSQPTGPPCPLTGLPAPGGVVPQRPAMAIKIGNNPAAWPQSGLNEADVVFEEPIEGAITRLLAIFQCHGASKVGPVRSTRWVDTRILPQFGHPGFAFAGGIIPDEHLVARSGVFDLNFTRYYDAAYVRSGSRVAPENLYTSTSKLWAIDKSRTPPPSIFQYSRQPPVGLGKAVSSVELTWSSICSVKWVWDKRAGYWIRYHNGTEDFDTSGNPVHATNVVVEVVRVTRGPYPEDVELNHGVHSHTVGSGPALILRNGVAIKATWHRPGIHEAATFLGRNGTLITLAPGNTWVELLPVYGSIHQVSTPQG
jgi:hypothetical protein